MTTPRLRAFRPRSGLVLAIALLAIMASPAGVGFFPKTAFASPLNSVPTVSVTVPAGGSAFLQVRALALQPGSVVPQGPLALAPQPLASDRLRITLYYGMNWGYADSNPQQVAYAVWWAQDGTWPAQDHSIAERIANAAASAPGLPTWNPDGRSLLGLVAQGQLALADLQLSPSDLSPAAGVGTLSIRNTGSQDYVVYLPYGTLFTGASGSVLVWATGIAEGQPTPAATNPPATATSVPQVSPTATVSYKQGYTPGPEATSTVSTKAPPEPPTETATPVPAMPPVAQPKEQPTASSAKAPPQTQNNTTGNTTTGQAPATGPAKSAAQQAAASNQTQQKGSDLTSAERALSQPAATVKAGVPATNGGSAPPPPPVGTVQAEALTPGAAPPKPELTKIASIVAGTATPEGKAGEPTPTEAPKIILPSVKPTAAPTPVGTPKDPQIIVNGDTSVQPPVTSPPGVGPKPSNNPTTGGGPSPLPAWLALFSAIMMLGGWSLRRMGNAAVAPIKTSSDSGNSG